MNSLGLDKTPQDTRVVVAMSGGVDSSVTAALLHAQGFDVVGVTLQLYDHGKAIARKGACCAGQDIHDAKRVAEEQGFPHYVLNYEDAFRQAVIDDFVETYLRGQTPIPCVKCNQTVKFRDLLKVARDLGADCMATGHYIRRVVNPATGRAELHRAADPAKDQSYFLFATTQDQLDFLRFPLGGWTKEETRVQAHKLGLLNCDKPDSQDICFVPGGDYASVVSKIAPDSETPGDIVHLDGRRLGRHQGIVRYTVGQRKGLGIGGGHNEENDPFYVLRIDPETNRVIVGPKEALACDIVTISHCNWLDEALRRGAGASAGADMGTDIEVKLRSVSGPAPARLFIHKANGAANGAANGMVNAADSYTDENEGAEIHLSTPQYGIAPGQAAVCYQGDRVLGGGWISATQNSTLAQAA